MADLRKIALFALFIVGLALSARAQTAPPGWTIVANAAGWRADSPDQGRGQRVRMVLYPVVRSSAPIESWLVNESARRAQAVGRIVWTQPGGVSNEPNQTPNGGALVGFARTVTDARGLNVNIIAYAYDTNDGRQLVLLLKPALLPESNGAYQASIDHLADAVHAGVAYVPGRRSAPPPVAQAQRSTPTQTQTAESPPPNGRNCRREPLWRFRRSVFCQPSGVCADREIYDYEWVCDQ